uniref:Antimicrobial peptide VpCT4 n=1 Tax=Mesomexovis punctatus TaxID=1532993 RepID=NDBT4_MESPU
MKTQFVILIVAIVILQLISQSEALWGALLGLGSTLLSKLGKRGVQNMDQFDDIFEPELSEADLRYLQDLLR